MRDRQDSPLFDFLYEHQTFVAGGLAFTVAFALIAGNAFYAQRGKHPDPLYKTRQTALTPFEQSRPNNLPVLDNNRTDGGVLFTNSAAPVAIGQTEQRLITGTKRIPVPVSARNARAQIARSAERSADAGLMAKLQNALAFSGDYHLEIDGKYGPATRQAIIDYQSRNRMVVSGDASAQLLDVILTNNQRGIGLLSAKKNQHGSDGMQQFIQADNQANNPPIAGGEEYELDMIRRVQAGLSNFGEADIAVDGVYGEATATAIADFQRKYDLPVTGRPDFAVIKKMIDIGALSRS